ncbi:MAG: hypothetical protein M4579_003594 [Chaenotheca gracillima]|nr:MAG: hypothetical protein M4579_003594 [Chaenotheca gracillima]
MGNVSSRLDDGAALYLKDQTKLSIASLTISNSSKRVLYNIVPNAFPTSKIAVKREPGDEGLVDFVQDPDPPASAGSPHFLLRLNNEDELFFDFSFVVRQRQSGDMVESSPVDTAINGLTYAFASNPRDLDNLVTREFHADPNLHKNSNVQLVGDYTTAGSSSVQFNWSWKWRPPKVLEERGGGWRNCCSFLEYDQRAHRLNTLASFSFWVQDPPRVLHSPNLSSPGFESLQPPKIRVASSQSIESRISGSDARADFAEPPSPNLNEPVGENAFGLAPTMTGSTVKVDVNCQRPGEDMSAVGDGPLFRATMTALEQKTGSMRVRMKKVLKRAEAAQQAQLECNDAVAAFMDALRDVSASEANAIQPAIEHYFERIAREILGYERQNTGHVQKLIIEPLTKLYHSDIKQAEAKKREFEDESTKYYAYLGRYLGQRSDSLKDKKRAESDSKYQTKRRNYELKRFDYSSFMQDLHGGRKEQEVLSHLTRYADAQTRSYLKTAKKVDEMMPQLEALTSEVKEADKEFRFQRTEREEKRRLLEKGSIAEAIPESTPALANPSAASNTNGSYVSDSELGRADSTGSMLRSNPSGPTSTSVSGQPGSYASTTSATTLSTSPGSLPANGIVASPGSQKYKGIRDIEEKDHAAASGAARLSGQQRKEGLLWALSRPGSHVDPKGLNKQAWHKFWIVLDQGKLSEYSNWKQKLDQHMEPIDLRMASVREARNAERRFCFEVITPQFKRVYQATSEEDMTNWISAINNALQSAVEGRGLPQSFKPAPTDRESSRRDIGSVLTGKSTSYAGHSSLHYHSHNSSNPTNSVNRRTTVGARPSYTRTNSNSFEDTPDKLLQIVREADQGNCWCADCESGIKTEWVSINLGIVLCIECSGIHRSLGTHISKVRSLTLDTTSFTTDIVELLLQIGNRVSNMIWEAKLDRSRKPTPNATREQRLKFITAKYVDREFVTPISSTLSHYSTPDETLLASIKKNDLHGVLYAIALRANTNAADRSRNTHAIFLALAATDPASPAQVHQTPPTSSSSSSAASAKVIPFPIAELLVQNGGEIPDSKPAFPLSRNAEQYIEQKKPKPSPAGGSRGGDTLGALPIIGAGSKNEPGPLEKQQEREARLQKRSSATARYYPRAAPPVPDR